VILVQIFAVNEEDNPAIVSMIVFEFSLTDL